MKKKRNNKLPLHTRLTLFISSYIPLFVIIILKQIFEHAQFFTFGGFTADAISLFFSKFLISGALFLFCVLGITGLLLFTRTMKKRLVNSGERVEIIKIQNKNNESIGYIATYLIPFMYQSFSTPFEIYSFAILMSVIFLIYVNSTLIVVNPVLSLRYSLYDIEYIDLKNGQEKNGTFIITQHNVRRLDRLVIKDLGNNTYFGKLEENNE